MVTHEAYIICYSSPRRRRSSEATQSYCSTGVSLCKERHLQVKTQILFGLKHFVHLQERPNQSQIIEPSPIPQAVFMKPLNQQPSPLFLSFSHSQGIMFPALWLRRQHGGRVVTCFKKSTTTSPSSTLSLRKTAQSQVRPAESLHQFDAG